ncbi:MAG: hypothetical protein ACOYOK_07490, partial [Pseudobdellovibrionaceae bacterium]
MNTLVKTPPYKNNSIPNIIPDRHHIPSRKPAHEITTPEEIKDLDPAPADDILIRLFYGLGLNYVTYSEDLNEVSTGYGNLGKVNSFFGIQIQDDKYINIIAQYRATPISFDHSSANLDSLQSEWKTLSFLNSNKIKSNPTNTYFINWGFQAHQLPLSLFKTADRRPAVRDIL